MKIKGIQFEDFINYKIPSMIILTSYCTFKCDKECGKPVCQNSPLAADPIHDIDDDTIIRRYIDNPITKAIVFAGLEPFEQAKEMHKFLDNLRNNYHCDDTVVIYTGFTEEEIQQNPVYQTCLYDKDKQLFKNIVIKYGRYIPDQEKHFDETLGVYLASDNQYAKTIS